MFGLNSLQCEAALKRKRTGAGDSPLQAARIAKRGASEAVRDGLDEIGAGAGPVDALGVT